MLRDGWRRRDDAAPLSGFRRRLSRLSLRNPNPGTQYSYPPSSWLAAGAFRKLVSCPPITPVAPGALGCLRPRALGVGTGVEERAGAATVRFPFHRATSALRNNRHHYERFGRRSKGKSAERAVAGPIRRQPAKHANHTKQDRPKSQTAVPSGDSALQTLSRPTPASRASGPANGRPRGLQKELEDDPRASSPPGCGISKSRQIFRAVNSMISRCQDTVGHFRLSGLT